MAPWARPLALLGGLGVVVAAATWACLPALTADLCGNGFIDPGESCDPGDNQVADCTPACTIACTPFEDGGRAFLDNPRSNHCYLTANRPAGNASAADTCRTQRAHLVTLVDDNEAQAIVHAFGSDWPGSARYWVGLDGRDAATPYYSAAPNEPGWSSPRDCSGCFMHGVDGGSVPIADGGAEAGPANFVIAQKLGSNSGSMAAIGPRVRAQVVCEREPIGSRSTECLDHALCFSVAATTTTESVKHYVYFQTATTAEQAEATCAALTDAGTASLVVLKSRAEREQVIYELNQLQGLHDISFSGQFWIGLAYRVVSDAGDADAGAGSLEWVWDDGKPASLSSDGNRPAVWGNHQPGARGPARAYIDQSTGYDTGLAYANEDIPDEPALHSFVCQTNDP
jgi:hypothetical protein